MVAVGKKEILLIPRFRADSGLGQKTVSIFLRLLITAYLCFGPGQ